MTNLQKEIETFLPVVGYESLYVVSNIGTVKSFRNKIKAGRKISTGYITTTLYRENTPSIFLIHRLVAIAFIPNPENKPFVNHINGIKTDNRSENLEWVTVTENIHHAIRIGLRRK